MVDDRLIVIHKEGEGDNIVTFPILFGAATKKEKMHRFIFLHQRDPEVRPSEIGVAVLWRSKHLRLYTNAP